VQLAEANSYKGKQHDLLITGGNDGGYWAKKAVAELTVQHAEQEEVSEPELNCVRQEQQQAGQHSVKMSEQAVHAESVTETALDCLELEQPELDYIERDQHQAGQHSVKEQKVNQKSVTELQEQQRQFEEDKMRGNESPEIPKEQQLQFETAELQKGNKERQGRMLGMQRRREEQQVQYEEQRIRSETDERSIKLQLEKRVLFTKQLSIKTQQREIESQSSRDFHSSSDEDIMRTARWDESASIKSVAVMGTSASVCVLLCFIKPILGNRYVRSRGFIVSEPRETQTRSEIADVQTSPCPPLDNLGCPDPHPSP